MFSIQINVIPLAGLNQSLILKRTGMLFWRKFCFFPRKLEYAIVNLDEAQLATPYREGAGT